MNLDERVASIEATVRAQGEVIRDQINIIRDAIRDRQSQMETVRRETAETHREIKALSVTIAGLAATQDATIDVLKEISAAVLHQRTGSLRRNSIVGGIGTLVGAALAYVSRWLT